MNAADCSPDFTTEDLQSLQATVARFARQAIAPHVPAWEEAGQFDRSLYTEAAQLGLLGLGYPEHLGGTVSERVYREVKVMTIGGGAEEIMKELAAKQLGI